MVNYKAWVIMMYQCRFINSNKFYKCYPSGEPWGPSPHWHYQDILVRVTVSQPGMGTKLPAQRLCRDRTAQGQNWGWRVNCACLGSKSSRKPQAQNSNSGFLHGTREPQSHICQDPKSTVTWMHSSIPKPENKLCQASRGPERELTW